MCKQLRWQRSKSDGHEDRADKKLYDRRRHATRHCLTSGLAGLRGMLCVVVFPSRCVAVCVCVCLGFLPAARSPQFLTLTLTRTTPLSSSADMVGSPLWGVPFRDALSSSRLKIESKITMDGGSRFSYSFDKYIENSVNKKRKTTSILLTSFKIKAPLQDEKKLSCIKK